MTAVAAPAVTPRVGQVLRRWRFWLVIGLVVLLIVVVQLVSTAAARIATPFDPDSTAPSGARALAQVLRQQGVTVQVVRSLAAAESAGGTLLVDDGAQLLPASAWDALLASRARVVVASPSASTVARLAPGLQTASATGSGVATADCHLALARRAATLALDGADHALRGAGATVCFRDRNGGGQVATLRAGGVRLLLLADRALYTNERIGSAGNAAVALTALGATDRLVWYSPDPLELLGGTRTLQQLTPPWVTPVAGLLLLAGATAALWRGRRLGPIVVERLPVVVRSRETVEGRARLYERGSAHLRAADALRIGAVGRIAPLLGLSRSATVEEVAGAASRTTGRPSDAVTALLLTTEPRNDRDLVRISDDLAELEAAVRAAVAPGRPTKGSP